MLLPPGSGWRSRAVWS